MGTRGARPSHQDVLHVEHRDAAADPGRHSYARADAYACADAYASTDANRGPDSHRRRPGLRRPNRRRPQCPGVPVVGALFALRPKGRAPRGRRHERRSILLTRSVAIASSGKRRMRLQAR